MAWEFYLALLKTSRNSKFLKIGRAIPYVGSVASYLLAAADGYDKYSYVSNPMLRLSATHGRGLAAMVGSVAIGTIGGRLFGVPGAAGGSYGGSLLATAMYDEVATPALVTIEYADDAYRFAYHVVRREVAGAGGAIEAEIQRWRLLPGVP